MRLLKKVIGGVYPQDLPARIDFSLREVEIMLYCLLNDFNKLIKCRELMTYRPRRAFSHIWKTLKTCLQNIRDCEAYKVHLVQTVGLLFQLESGKGKQNDIEAIEEVPDIQATVCLGTIDSQDMDNHQTQMQGSLETPGVPRMSLDSANLYV